MSTIGTAVTDTETRFVNELAALDAPSILELGTLRWEADRPTHHQEWAPHAGRYVKSDIEPGPDVDLVADAHDLRPFTWREFDALIAVSVWEHLARPWVAAVAAARVVRPGGLLYVATHQTFPIHGYPRDYFRMSTEALEVLFDGDNWEPLSVGYAYPCTIVPPAEVTRWNTAAPAWLNVEGAFRRR